MKKREFLKKVAVLTTGVTLLPKCGVDKATDATNKIERIRTAHIGVGGMGMEDLQAVASHKLVDVAALCDVCLLYTSPSPRDKRQSRMPSSA